jgi:hypothetical protein
VAAPTFVSYGASVFNVNTTPKSVTPTVQVGDVIVVFGLTGNDLTQINTPSDGVNTYATPQNIQVTDFVYAKVWTTTATTAATLTISATRAGTGGDHWGLGYFVHRGSDGIGNSNKANASGAPSVSLTTAAANSAVIAFLGDWNAAATTGKTWRTVNSVTPSVGNGAEKLATVDSGIYTVYAAVWNDVGAAGANTYGMTAPTGQKYSIIVIEVKGQTAADVTATDTPSGVRIGQTDASIAFDVLVSDAPSGERLGQSPLTVSVGVNANDTPSGIRLGSSPATVVLDVLVSDTPSGQRGGASPVGVTFDSVMVDTPRGVRQGQSATTVILDTVIVDSPSGERLGQSSAVVGTVVQVQDVPNGARLGQTSSTVTISVAFLDTPAGAREGQSGATVVFDVMMPDLPSGVRLGASGTTVTSTTGVGDVPSGVRIGQSPVQVTIDVRTLDTPTGARLGLSPSTVSIGGVPTGVTVADQPSGVRSGASGATVTVSLPSVGEPTIFTTISEVSIDARSRPFIFDVTVGVNIHAQVGQDIVQAIVDGA